MSSSTSVNVSSITIPESPYQLPTLYYRNLKTKVLMWCISANDLTLYITDGHVNGEKSITTVNCDNSKSMWTECKKRYVDKIRLGYSTDINVKQGYTKGMKGFLYHKGSLSPEDFPLLIQRKYNGIRGLIQRFNNMTTLRSYKGKAYTHLDFITEEATKLLELLPCNTVIDSELYICPEKHPKNLEYIRSVFSSVVNIHEDLKDLRCYIFDIYSHGGSNNPEVQFGLKTPFVSRHSILHDAFNSYCEMYGEPQYLIMVENNEADNEDEIDEYLLQAEIDGYEGVVIKKPTKPYVHGKCSNILKYKSFFDADFLVVDIVSSLESNKPVAILVLETKNGKRFNQRPSGTIEIRAEYLANHHKYIGRLYTVRFSRLLDNGIPLDASGVSFRDYE